MDCNLAEGIAVFVQEKAKYEPRFEEAGWRFLPTPDVRMQPLNKGIAKYLICLDNEREHGVGSVDAMRTQVYATLDAFAKEGVKTVAMNAIHCNALPNPNVRPESYQNGFVEEYVAAHPDAFNTICLVDKRGGFKNFTMQFDVTLEKLIDQFVKNKGISANDLKYK